MKTGATHTCKQYLASEISRGARYALAQPTQPRRDGGWLEKQRATAALRAAQQHVFESGFRIRGCTWPDLTRLGGDHASAKRLWIHSSRHKTRRPRRAAVEGSACLNKCTGSKGAGPRAMLPLRRPLALWLGVGLHSRLWTWGFWQQSNGKWCGGIAWVGWQGEGYDLAA
jgi:hypothetical protein